MQPVPPESLRIECSHVVVQRQRVWRALDALGHAPAAVAVLAGHIADRLGLGVIAARIVAVAAAAVVTVVHRASVAARVVPPTPGVLDLSAGTVRIEAASGVWELTARDAHEGWVVPLVDGFARFVVRFSDGRTLIGTTSPEHRARAVLDALSVGPSQRALRTSLASPLDRFWGRDRVISLVTAFTAAWAVVFVEVMRQGDRTIALGMIAALAVASMVMAWACARPRATVGADGVEIRGVFKRDFVPYARVAAVEIDEQGVRLALHDGGAFRLVTGSTERVQRPEPGITGSAVALRDVLEDRIAAAMTVARRDAAPDVPSHARLDRNGRSLAEWRADLEALGSALLGYRDESISRADLLRLLTDPAAPAERRIAAALALTAPGADHETLERIARAANTTAHGPVARALRSVAHGTLGEPLLSEAIASDLAARAA